MIKGGDRLKRNNAIIIAVVVVVAVMSIFGISRLDGFDLKQSEDDSTSSASSFSTSVRTGSTESSGETSAPVSSTVLTTGSTGSITEETVSTVEMTSSQTEESAAVRESTARQETSQTTTMRSTEASSVTSGKSGTASDEAGNKDETVIFGERKTTSNSKISTVYFTKDISASGMLKIFKKLGKDFGGKVACKLSTGESSASYYLRPELIKDTVKYVNGTIVECNTAYGGVRSSTVLHKQLAADHGFTSIADVDILDEKGSLKIPVENGKYLDYNLVGSHFADYDSFLVLSHFKGHPMGGFGGSIKNISIGLASRQGKCRIHTAGKSNTIMVGLDQDAFLECMADAAKSVCDYLGGSNITFINVMNNLSVDCDCVALPSAPKMADVGILASDDPVALDQACVDIVYLQKDGDGKSLVSRIESLNGIHTLERAEENGLGSRNYDLVSID